MRFIAMLHCYTLPDMLSGLPRVAVRKAYASGLSDAASFAGATSIREYFNRSRHNTSERRPSVTIAIGHRER